MNHQLQTVAAMACMKSFLMVFNFLFWLSGVIFLIIGIWMEGDLYVYAKMSTEYSNIMPYALITIGAFIFLIGSFACCCTLKGQPYLLYIYGGILAFMFVMELSCSIAVYTYRTKLMEGFDKGITNAMNSYYNESTEVAHDFDEVQQTLKCCGKNNASDWQYIDRPEIPPSCCVKLNCDVFDDSQIFEEGCYAKIEKFLSTNIRSIGVIAMVIATFPLFGMTLSCCLARLLNKHKYEQMS